MRSCSVVNPTGAPTRTTTEQYSLPLSRLRGHVALAAVWTSNTPSTPETKKGGLAFPQTPDPVGLKIRLERACGPSSEALLTSILSRNEIRFVRPYGDFYVIPWDDLASAAAYWYVIEPCDGINSIQVLPGVRTSGLPAESVKTNGSAAPPFDQLIEETVPPVKT